MTKSPVVHQSAIDRWVACMLLLSPVASIAIGLWLMFQQRPDDAFMLFLAGAGTTLLTVACCLPCRYTLLADAVSIRCGIMVYQVPYDSIRKVERSATLRNGPALSLKRVIVVTDKKSIVLSPKDRDDFVTQLSERAGLSTD